MPAVVAVVAGVVMEVEKHSGYRGSPTAGAVGPSFPRSPALQLQVILDLCGLEAAHPARHCGLDLCAAVCVGRPCQPCHNPNLDVGAACPIRIPAQRAGFRAAAGPSFLRCPEG
jgi:hypothetical protein